MPAESPMPPRPTRPPRSRDGARQQRRTLRGQASQAAELRQGQPGSGHRRARSLRRSALWSLGALAVLLGIMLVLHRPVSDGMHTACPDCPGPAQVGSDDRSNGANQARSGGEQPSASAAAPATGRLPPIITGLSGPASTLRLGPRAVAGDVVDATTQSTGTVGSLAGTDPRTEGTDSSTINPLAGALGSADSSQGSTQISASGETSGSASSTGETVVSASTSSSDPPADGSNPDHTGVGPDPGWGLLSILSFPLIALGPAPTAPGEPPPPPPPPPLPPDPILPPGSVSLPASGWLLGAGMLAMALVTARPANRGGLPHPSLPRPVASPMHSGRPRRGRSAPK
jgi:hypothetical protein